jgi:predicted KAP-like P-loop ATPase
VSSQQSYNDKPISDPSEDRFGIDPFAKALARSIEKMQAPEGTVMALNGPWGSGKSSAVNLIRHHLKAAVDNDELTIINFACWWFRGEEALALAFFRELYAGLGPSLGAKFKKNLPKLGAKLLRAGSTIGPAIDLAGGAGAGSVASGAMNWVSGLIEDKDSVEKLHSQLVKSLAAQDKRFLIIIDDIDRLAPEEALLIFRLVKSVGRLPNVVYLLVFDRALAEKIVAERYPSEGPHFLEKIIQAAFDVPEPRIGDLHEQLQAQIAELCGPPPTDDIVRYMNVFYDVVAPEIRSPRDLNRLMNALSVTWPAVGEEVNPADFIGLETLRILQPSIHRAIRLNKDTVCGARGSMNNGPTSDEADMIFFGPEKRADVRERRRSLMRLFPRLEAAWSNISYGHDFESGWAKERRVCTTEHFDSYFRLSLDDNALPKREIDQLVQNAGDKVAIQRAFRDALKVTRSQGATRAALLLEQLNLHAADIPNDKVGPLLKALFEIADELDVEADVVRGFGIGDNSLRLHWLTRRLTLERFSPAERSALLVTACETAPLGWLVRFSESVYRDHHPREGRNPKAEEDCLVLSADADRLRKKELKAVRDAAKSGTIIDHRQLPSLLYRWRDLSGKDGAEVKRWTKTQLKKDDAVAKLARAFTSYSWSQGMGMAGLGDRVSKRNTRANVDSLEMIMDKANFRKRVETLAGEKSSLDQVDVDIVRTFLKAWKEQDDDPLG